MNEYKVSASSHPVKAVTVYKSSKAEVTRSFALDLLAGRNKIEITDIPTVIDRESIRVSGLGNARLFDVVVNTSAGHKSSDTIKHLHAKKQKLEKERSVREHEAEILVSYGRTVHGQHISPEQVQQFLQSFLDISGKNVAAIADINEKIAEVEREIEAEVKKGSVQKGTHNAIITMTVVAEGDGPVEFKVTYLVSNASWSPTYELQATTENGKPSSKVRLQYRARISQATGEDWQDTMLTLSTVESGSISQTIPANTPLYVRPRAVQPQHRKGGGGLFGNNVGGGPFGNAAGRPTAGGLFGQPVAAPASGVSSSSAPLAPPNPPQQTAQLSQPLPGASLFSGGQNGFGGSSSAFGQSMQQQSVGGLFGQAAPAGGSGLFGGSSGAFGQSMQQQSVGGLFGQAAPAGGSGLFGSSTGTQPAQPPADAVDDFEEVERETTELSSPSMVVSETPLALSYSVEEPVTIPSDGEDHQVSVSMLSLEANISYVAVPRIDPRVYLQCSIKNTSNLRLLPGPVSVILNDSYVSKTSIGDTNVGDTHYFNLGHDSSIRIAYKRKQSTEKISAGSFSEQWNVTTHSTEMSVHNLHQFDISRVIIRDAIPHVPEESSKRAKVVLKIPAQLTMAERYTLTKVPDQEKGGKNLEVQWLNDESGTFQWWAEVGAGERIELHEEWEVKTPADEQWIESGGPHGQGDGWKGPGLFGRKE